MPWERYNEDIAYRLIDFAQKYYPGFRDLPTKYIHKLFETYKDFTYVYKDGRLLGFVLFQEWPDALNCLMICLPFTDKKTNLKLILQGRKMLSKEQRKKKIVWFDEKDMKAKGV